MSRAPSFVVATFVVALSWSVDARAQSRLAVPLPASGGWRASSIHESETGVWYAHVDQVVDAFGQPEVICCDDAGNFKVLTVYSGQWTSNVVRCDGAWLAPTRPADVDPRVEGRELYAAGQNGTVHQVTMRGQPFARFTFEAREIGHAAGEEFHAVLAADLIPGGGDELLVFGITGAVYRLQPDDGADGGFEMQRVARLPGRVRDVAVLPAVAGTTPTVLGASRTGHLLAMRLSHDGMSFETVLREDCGIGRIALHTREPIAYVTRDDGVLLRVDLAAGAARTAIYAGGQGLRGVAAGDFFADGREAVACYGYDRRVHMVTAPKDPGGRWQVETIFEAEQRGHWLTVGELDGRNGTDELVATGFDGQVVLLARPPGYANASVAVPEEEQDDTKEVDVQRPLRVAARIAAAGFEELTPLSYRGGFESKALLYETLVRRGPDGRIVPGLARSYRVVRDGTTVTFELREGATWHDGSPVTADDVVAHFRRWVGLPEHDWLRSNRRIVSVQASAPHTVRIDLDRPCALLADLCAINPCAIVGPGARDREGRFVRPVGSAPFAFVDVVDDDRALRLRRRRDGVEFDLWRTGDDPLAALEAGEVDAVVGSWLVPVDPAAAARLRDGGEYEVVTGPGSAVRSLGMRIDRGPLADVGRRRAVARAIDRDALVRDVLHGFGDACAAWAAPSIEHWPRARAVAEPDEGVRFDAPLGLDPSGVPPSLLAAITAQLERAHVPVQVLERGCPDADLWFERSHGVPYDPFTVVERFGRPAGGAHAATPPRGGRDAKLADLVGALSDEAHPDRWPQHYARIQARLDELLPVVPLFVAQRIAVVRKGVAVGPLDHDMYRLPEWLPDEARR